jgi:DNA-binding beta-propeller fold protein YncE
MPTFGHTLRQWPLVSASLVIVGCTLTSKVSELTKGDASVPNGSQVDGGTDAGSGGTTMTAATADTGTGGTGGSGAPGGAAGAPDEGAVALYWVDSGDDCVHRANIDGTGGEPIVEVGDSASFFRSMAIDEAGGKIYFTDDGLGKLQRANLDGSDVEDIVPDLENPVGVDVDPTNGKVYYADQGAAPAIYRANLDGTSPEPLIEAPDVEHPYGLVLDHVGAKVYFVDNGDSIDAVLRADLDGSNLENLNIAGIDAPIEIALDPIGRKIYWSDIGDYSGDGVPPPVIRRANLDGSDAEDVITSANSPTLSIPLGLQVDGVARKLYYVDGGSSGVGAILSADLDGAKVSPHIIALTEPRGLALAYE